jgi:hypothetical protein
MVMERPRVHCAFWLDAKDVPQAGGMQRGRAAGPLAKIVLDRNGTFCITTHILQSILSACAKKDEPLLHRVMGLENSKSHNACFTRFGVSGGTFITITMQPKLYVDTQVK